MTAGVVAAVRRRLGRRGAYLLLTGVTWLLYGIGTVLDPREGTARAAVVLRAAAPLQTWGWVWVAGGVLAILAAWSRCPARRTWGFAAAFAPPALWALAFGWAWVDGQWPQAWTGAVVWAGAALKVAIVATWRPDLEKIELPPLESGGRGG
ncbi:hypothetical protein [Streptomyces lonarensis]|uniref:Integral membrane protein n=1 Tax=Streptomyces lonarensis TaxID=700599 RepID=A0A7X6HX89_9ACTN|nr:hypothetical protein [Streptomyces lonarensis]NJQ04301.1 hypothetical protein [Streptomyces lonarensis]